VAFHAWAIGHQNRPIPREDVPRSAAYGPGETRTPDTRFRKEWRRGEKPLAKAGGRSSCVAAVRSGTAAVNVSCTRACTCALVLAYVLRTDQRPKALGKARQKGGVTCRGRIPPRGGARSARVSIGSTCRVQALPWSPLPREDRVHNGGLLDHMRPRTPDRSGWDAASGIL